MPLPISELKILILENMPDDGAAIGNQALLALLEKAAPEISEADYQAARDALVAEGTIEKGRGRGGSVSLVLGADDDDDAEDDAAGGDEDDEFSLEIQDEPAGEKRRATAGKAKKRKAQALSMAVKIRA